MPSFGIHLIVLDEVCKKLQRSSDTTERNWGGYLGASPKFASLGAIGPDLVYYLKGQEAAATLATFYKLVNEVGRFLNETTNQMGAASSLVDVTSDIVKTAQALAETLEIALTDLFVDIFNSMSGDPLHENELQQDLPSTDWKWGDVLHWHSTGRFARGALDRAKKMGDSDLIAYCLAYHTHLATDFVGHAYVNHGVGGPGRGYTHRHHIAEAYMDAWKYRELGLDITNSKILERFLDSDATELKKLWTLLADQMYLEFLQARATPQPFCSPPTAGDLKKAYGTMLTLFGYVTRETFLRPPTPPGFKMPPLPGQYGSITKRVQSLFPPSHHRWSLRDFLRALLFLLSIIPAILADLALLVAEIIAGAIKYPLEWALYVVQSAIYAIYVASRRQLVLSGLVFPLLSEIDDTLGKQFIPCVARDSSYPRAFLVPIPELGEENIGGRKIKVIKNGVDSLNYPTAVQEVPGTLCSVYTEGMNCDDFISGLQRDEEFIKKWETSTTSLEWRTYLSSYVPEWHEHKRGFGNATDLTILLLSAGAKFDSINLDADRGYGYKSWLCDGGLRLGKAINERFA